MGLDKETIVRDIEEFVKILGDNEQVMYFAAINIEAKYSKNRYALVNLLHWFGRLEKSIGRVIDFMDLESEGAELSDLFKIIDDSKLTKAEKEKLKTAFKETLNRIKEYRIK
jgi:aspartate carbamoyltransferase regulatory subunit